MARRRCSRSGQDNSTRAWRGFRAKKPTTIRSRCGPQSSPHWARSRRLAQLRPNCSPSAEREDWPTADSLIVRAVEILEQGRFRRLVDQRSRLRSRGTGRGTPWTHACSAPVRQRATGLRPLLTYALPVVSVQALLELARAFLAVVDPAGARAALEQAQGILQQRPDLGTLSAAADQLQSRLGQIVVAERGASSLTTAELRLLPLLPTHLSFPEIGDRLFISRHTVKSQVNSLYRKLGVSSRGEAVDRMAELGLHV
jgi:LuxR family transcriptional regulator, maltose regulon positive regulatory protein